MRLIYLPFLLIIPAFFAAGEVALLRLRPSRVQGLIAEGHPGAIAIHQLQRRLRKALMVSQLGVTLSLVALGWMIGRMSLKWWPNDVATSQWLDGSLFVLIVIFTTLLTGLLPKALVLNRPEVMALHLAPLMQAVMKVLAPVLSVLESLATLLFRLVGLSAQWDALIPALSAGELETLIETGGVTGLQPDERNILEGVFALRDTQVREVMIPRSGMVTLPIEVCFSELMQAVHKTRHARFPVIGDSLDDVRGVIDLRGLAEPISKGILQPNTLLEPYLESAPKVLETSNLAELLPMIRSGQPLLLVVDEHGGTEGLVTAADLTGEIVGEEIEANVTEPYIEPIDGEPGTWFVAGNFEIIELNRQLKLELPEAQGHHTIAGFLLEKLQHVPTNGERLIYEEIEFQISAMKGPRIQRIKIVLPDLTVPQT